METLTDLFGQVTGFIDSLTELVTDSPITYLVILAFTVVDVIFPVIPAESAITAAAVLAGQGQLNIVWVMLAAGLGAFIGDNVAYWIGRLAGRPVAERLLRGRASLDGIEKQFDRRGGLFIIIGRFIPWGRTTVTIGAGVLHFPWKRFLLYDAIAVAIFPFPAALPGYIGGVVIQDRPWLALVIGFALSLLVGGAIALFQRWRGGGEEEEEEASDEGPEGAQGEDGAQGEEAHADGPPHARPEAPRSGRALGDGGTAGPEDGDGGRSDEGAPWIVTARPMPRPDEVARGGAPGRVEPLPDRVARSDDAPGP